METITETSSKLISLDADILAHAISNCEKEICDRFGAETLEILCERKEELILPKELAEEIEEYMGQLTVKEIQFCKKLLDTSSEEFKLLITSMNKHNITIAIDEELPRLKLVGKEKYVKEIYEQLKYKITEMEKGLEVVTETLSMQVYKLELFLLHGVDEKLKNDFHVDVKIEPRKQNITIKGHEKKVSLATKDALQKCSQIMEDHMDLNETGKRFLESRRLAMLNSGMKAVGLKGMVSLRESRGNKAKVLAFDDAKIKDVHSYLNSNMFEKHYVLEEDSLTLLRSNKWKEFCEGIATSTSVMMNTAKKNKISLMGKKSEVEETYEKLQDFMKRNTIVKVNIDMDEGYARYLSKYCGKDFVEIERKLEEQYVRVYFVEDEGAVKIDGTKDGVKEGKKWVEDILSNIAKDKICFDKPRMHKYLGSEEGKLFIEGIESKHKCLIQQAEDDEGTSSKILSIRPKPHPDKPSSKLLCSFETPEKVSLKVYKGDITAHGSDVIVNAANDELKHIGGVAKSILDAGGKEIQDECNAHVKAKGKVFEGQCFSGSPGKLPCKRLIHAVGPQWDYNKREKICKTLRVTSMRVFEEAMGYRSIALPAIGSGVYGIPKEICADIMIKSAEEFSKKYDNSTLKEIHFVNIDDKTSQVFVKKFRETFGESSSFSGNQANNSSNRFGSFQSRPFFQAKERNRESNSPHQSLRRRKPDDFIITKDNMKISVVVGDLSKYKVIQGAALTTVLKHCLIS